MGTAGIQSAACAWSILSCGSSVQESSLPRATLMFIWSCMILPCGNTVHGGYAADCAATVRAWSGSTAQTARMKAGRMMVMQQTDSFAECSQPATVLVQS